MLLGNAGAGKTTLARRWAAERGLAHVDLDALAWDPGPVRRPLALSVAELEQRLARHARWVAEGSYASLARAALARADELVLLTPGVAACLERCRARAWEPAKYASPAEQQQALAFLLEWVARYETRTDEYGLAAHRALLAQFAGARREIAGEAGDAR